MKIHSASVKDVSVTIAAQLMSLTHGEGGFMLPVFRFMYMNEHPMLSNGTVAYVEEDGKILGWGLVFTMTQNGEAQRLQYLYVDKLHRKKGIGTAIAQFGAQNNLDLKGHIEYSTCFRRAGIQMADRAYMKHFVF